MKKKIITIIVTIILILLTVRLFWTWWLYNYNHTKHVDNLSHLENLIKMEEDEIKDELKGYKRGAFLNIWDDPTYQTEYEDYWEIDGYTLIVRYDHLNRVINSELIKPNDVE